MLQIAHTVGEGRSNIAVPYLQLSTITIALQASRVNCSKNCYYGKDCVLIRIEFLF